MPLPHYVSRVHSYHSEIHSNQEFSFTLDGHVHDFTIENKDFNHNHKTLHILKSINKFEGTETIHDLKFTLDFDMWLNAPDRDSNSDFDPILVRPVFSFEMDYNSSSSPKWSEYYYYDKHHEQFEGAAEIHGDQLQWDPELMPYWYKFYGEWEQRNHGHVWHRSNFHHSLNEIFKFNSNHFKTTHLPVLKSEQSTNYWTGNIKIKLQFLDTLTIYSTETCHIDDIRIETTDVTKSEINTIVIPESNAEEE